MCEGACERHKLAINLQSASEALIASIICVAGRINFVLPSKLFADPNGNSAHKTRKVCQFAL